MNGRADTTDLPFANKAHPLTKVTPHQYLNRCFQSFGCFCRFIGILPIEILPDGSSSFTIKSRRFLHTVTYAAICLVTAGVYFPVYLCGKSELKSTPVLYISENLFVGGQIIGLTVTIFLIPWIAHGVVDFWNGLQSHITFIVNNGQGPVFQTVYTRSRISLILNLIMQIIYAIICWRDLAIENIGTWYQSVGIVTFILACFCHLVPIMLLMFFIIMLGQCFKGLTNILEKGESEKLSLIKTRECLQIFEGLFKLNEKLGKAFGLYFVMEMIVLMTSVLMNVFTALSGFAQRDLWSTLGCFLGYVIILVSITERGEHLTELGKECLAKIRQDVYNMPDPVEMVFLHRISNARKPILTAANFFSIDRKLSIAMASTLATYTIVILQFKLNGYNWTVDDKDGLITL